MYLKPFGTTKREEVKQMEILVQPFDYDVMPCECDEGGGSGGTISYDDRWGFDCMGDYM